MRRSGRRAGSDFPCPDGYRYRTNWDCDKLYRAKRPNWHAVAYALRKPWQADAAIGPTYNAAINGAVYWKRFGASDTAGGPLPRAVRPGGGFLLPARGAYGCHRRADGAAYGKTLADRLRVLADCGFVVSKQEVYDARYFQGAYEWAISTGPRAILIKQPKLVVTFKPGQAETIGPLAPADVPALAAQHKDQPLGAPTAVVPTPAEVARLNERFMARPAWMPDVAIRSTSATDDPGVGGKVQPFYYRVAPEYVIKTHAKKRSARPARSARSRRSTRIMPSISPGSTGSMAGRRGTGKAT